VTRAPGSIKAAFAALMLHIRIVDGSDSYDKTVRNKLADLLLKSPGKPGFKKNKKKKQEKIFEPVRISNFEFRISFSNIHTAEVEAARRRDIPACKAQLVHNETATLQIRLDKIRLDQIRPDQPPQRYSSHSEEYLS
jgi:hypothetical protein